MSHLPWDVVVCGSRSLPFSHFNKGGKRPTCVSLHLFYLLLIGLAILVAEWAVSQKTFISIHRLRQIDARALPPSPLPIDSSTRLCVFRVTSRSRNVSSVNRELWVNNTRNYTKCSYYHQVLRGIQSHNISTSCVSGSIFPRG